MASWDDGIIDDFRAHGGHATSGYFVGKPLLLLTAVGAKSGERRTLPLIYTRDGDRYVIVASKGGAPKHPGWYHNLRANPIVEIEVEDKTFEARATPVTDLAERRRLYDQQIAVLPGFAGYERKTTRLIPVVVLDRI